MSKLGDYLEIVTKGTTPTTIGGSFKTAGINFIKAESITETGSLNHTYFSYIDEETNNKMVRSQLKENDIVMSIAGNLGRVAKIRKLDLPANTNQAVGIIRPNPCKINSDYLKYRLMSSEAQTKIKYSNAQSVQNNINLDNIRNLDLFIHEMIEQQKIASILNAIDYKIENNIKINSKFESIAKTIYDYWFLQFEFQNDDGKPYKSSGGKMIYNKELKRDIPEGWVVRRVKDCIQHINTGLNPRDNFVLNEGGNIKYVTVKNLTTDGIIDFTGCDLITKEVKNIINKRSMIAEGDILFASIAPLGRCFLIYETPEDWEINESVFSIRVDKEILNKEYLYMFFMSDWFIKKSEHASTGSIFNGIRISVLEDTLILVPPKNVLDRFKEVVEPLYEMKFNNGKQNQELTSLRDWLLPMLMNGQVSFKEDK